MGARWLSLTAIVAGVLSASLGLAGLVVAVATGGNMIGFVWGFLAASVGFGMLGLVTVLLEVFGAVKPELPDMPEGSGRRRAG